MDQIGIRVMMNFDTFLLINVPFSTFNIVANAFYIFCMVCPLRGEKIKQPLKLLLGSLIFSCIVYLMSFILLSDQICANDLAFTLALIGVSIYCLCTMMTTCVWLNFFYYVQIVPAQRALFIWIKKNIKHIIYCIWLLDRGLCVITAGVIVIDYIYATNLITDGCNSTVTSSVVDLPTLSPELMSKIHLIGVSIVKTHMFLCVCVMVTCNGSTVVYLCTHMRRMVANGQSLSCPRFCSQVRVTVTGIFQGILFVFCSSWAMYSFFSLHTLFVVDPYTEFTVSNLYMSGTTFSLGASQAVFRQRVADIWIRAAQWYKRPKVQESEQETSG